MTVKDLNLGIKEVVSINETEQTLKAFSETKQKLDKGAYKAEAIPDMAEARQ